MSMQVDIMADITIGSIPIGRIIMRVVAIATSAMFMHIDAQRPMPSPALASAHIVAAISAAEQASMHFCIMSISMPMFFIGMDFIMSIIMLMALISARENPGVLSPNITSCYTRAPCQRGVNP